MGRRDDKLVQDTQTHGDEAATRSKTEAGTIAKLHHEVISFSVAVAVEKQQRIFVVSLQLHHDYKYP